MPAEGAAGATLGGRVYLVTNSCSGAGLSAARELLHAGAAVVLTGATVAAVQGAVQQLRGEAQGAGAGMVEGGMVRL